MLSKFFSKSAQKKLIFSNKANFERGLFLKDVVGGDVGAAGDDDDAVADDEEAVW